MTPVAPPDRVLRAVQAAVGAPVAVEALGNDGMTWRAGNADVVVHVAVADKPRARLRREFRLYEWAATHGVPVPPVVAAGPDGSFLAIERVAADPPHGAAFVDAAVATVDALASAPWPPPELLSGRRPRRPRWRGIPVRAARLVAEGVPTREYFRVDRRVRRFPFDTLCHGDLHRKNVLYDGRAGVARLVDLDVLGPGPRHLDLLTLWTSVEDDDDRARLLTAVRARTRDDDDADDVDDVDLLRHWLALRYLWENVGQSRRGGLDRPRVAKAWAVLDEARRGGSQ